MPISASFPFGCPHCGKSMSVPERYRGKTVKCPNTACGKPIAFPVAVAVLSEEIPLKLPQIPRKLPQIPPPVPPQIPRRRRWPLVVGASVLLIVGVSVGVIALKGKMNAGRAIASRTSDPKSPATKRGDSLPGGGSKEFESADTKLKKTSPDSTEPETKPSTLPASPAPTAESTRLPNRGLTVDDTTLLKLSSAWHYVNGKRVTGSLETYEQHLEYLKKEAVKESANGKLAQLVLTNYLIVLYEAKRSSIRQELLDKGLKAEVANLAIRGALAGFSGEEIPSPFSRAFRDGPGKSGELWVDDLRDTEIVKYSLMVALGQANLNIADTFEREYAPRMGGKPLNWDSMPPQLELFDNYSGFMMNLIDLKYSGTETLTNVVYVTRLETTGLQLKMTPSQSSILDINEASGFEDKNDDVEELFGLQNYVGSMPQGTIVFVPTLKPNDAVRLILGNAEKDRLVGFSVAMYCDQGKLAEKKITPEKPAKKSTGNIAAKSGQPKYTGPHLGAWEAIEYEWTDSKSTASLVWDLKEGGEMLVKIPALESESLWNYLIDDTKNPKQIDLICPHGRFANKVMKGIYKVDKGVLTVCFPRDNAANVEDVSRPTEFDVSRQNDIQILRLKAMRDSP